MAGREGNTEVRKRNLAAGVATALFNIILHHSTSLSLLVPPVEPISKEFRGGKARLLVHGSSGVCALPRVLELQSTLCAVLGLP